MIKRLRDIKKRYLFVLFGLIISILVYANFNFSKEYEMSIGELIDLAQKDDDEAQFMLGAFYQQGIQVNVDLQESVKWYKRSAMNGNTYAMINLGNMYNEGKGVEQDSFKAFDWNLEAAKKGDASGMFNVSKKYEYGIGVEIDLEKAKYWGEKAEKLKNANDKS